VPIHRLMDDLSATTAAKLNRAYVPLPPIQAVDFIFEIFSDRHPASPSSDTTTAVEDTLWVDRYRPHRFTELMGNERVARETMAWVKQWDWCVFGKNKGKKRPRDGDENFNAEDEYHRPREKVTIAFRCWDMNLMIL